MSEFDETTHKQTALQIKTRPRKSRARTVLEEKVEDRFCIRVAELGGTAMKLQTPGRPGAPDRMVFLPKLPIELVELKTIGGRKETSQKKWHKFAMMHGAAEPTMLWTLEGVDRWALERRERIRNAT